MSTIGRSLERWLAWVNLSPWRAGGFVLAILAYLGTLAVTSYFWSQSVLADYVAAGQRLEDGTLWARIFLVLSVPALVLCVFILLFAATKKWWSLVLLIVAAAPVVFFFFANPSGVLGKYKRAETRDTLTEITGSPHVTEIIQTAMDAGRSIAITILLLCFLWLVLVQRKRRFADPSTRHLADDVHRRSALVERAIPVFLWVCPFVAVASIPLVALAGAANAS